MDISNTERRQIENEMIFRRGNEDIGDSLNKLDQMFIADDTPELIRDPDVVLRFRCECSDENCDARIPIKLGVYQTIHENRDTFIVKLKHQVEPIEKVIQTGPDYSIVKKNNSTPEPGDDLNKTAINNT